MHAVEWRTTHSPATLLADPSSCWDRSSAPHPKPRHAAGDLWEPATANSTGAEGRIPSLHGGSRATSPRYHTNRDSKTPIAMAKRQSTSTGKAYKDRQALDNTCINTQEVDVVGCKQRKFRVQRSSIPAAWPTHHLFPQPLIACSRKITSWFTNKATVHPGWLTVQPGACREECRHAVVGRSPGFAVSGAHLEHGVTAEKQGGKTVCSGLSEKAATRQSPA